MRLHDGEVEAAFRAELVTWLEANAPSDAELAESRASSADLRPWARAWQRRLFDAGWLVPGWAPELGGRNASPVEQMIYFEELARRRLPRSTNPQGLGIVAPSLRDHGTPAQQEELLVPTLRAELAWCIGMSEPGAGSDLAGLRTRAVLDGDHFVVDGQKVWTSGAHHADQCLCFVRSDPEAPRHRGISVLIIDMHAPGVEARPFPDLSDPGHLDFNEVFFTGVVVPRDRLVGELHGGWAISQVSLGHERAMLWIDYATTLQRAVDDLCRLAGRDAPEGGRIGDRDTFRDAAASLLIDAQALLAMGYRGFAKFLRGQAAPEHSLLKLFGSEAIQRACLVGTEALGSDAADRDLAGPPLIRPGSWAEQYLTSFGNTIPGGTSEIQRNIIAERVLGLPRR